MQIPCIFENVTDYSMPVNNQFLAINRPLKFNRFLINQLIIAHLYCTVTIQIGTAVYARIHISPTFFHF